MVELVSQGEQERGDRQQRANHSRPHSYLQKYPFGGFLGGVLWIFWKIKMKQRKSKRNSARKGERERERERETERQTERQRKGLKRIVRANNNQNS